MRNIDTLLIITHEVSPARHPAEGALDHDPAATRDLELLLVVGSTHDQEVGIGGFVQELRPVMGGGGQQMLLPGATLEDAVQDGLSPGTVVDVGGGEANHQESQESTSGYSLGGSQGLDIGVTLLILALSQVARAGSDRTAST